MQGEYKSLTVIYCSILQCFAVHCSTIQLRQYCHAKNHAILQLKWCNITVITAQPLMYEGVVGEPEDARRSRGRA